MKKILSILFLSALFFAACSKLDDATPNYGTFSIGTMNYSATSSRDTTFSYYSLYGKANDGSTISFTFKTMPTVSGNYTIVGQNSITSNNVVYILAVNATFGTNRIYESKDGGSVQLNVTVNGGTRKYSVPSFYCFNINDANDSILVTGNITR